MHSKEYIFNFFAHARASISHHKISQKSRGLTTGPALYNFSLHLAMGLKGQVVPISIPFYASSSGPYGLPCFNQRQQQIPVESMKSTCSPVYSTPLRRLLTTNRRFLKFCCVLGISNIGAKCDSEI